MLGKLVAGSSTKKFDLVRNLFYSQEFPKQISHLVDDNIGKACASAGRQILGKETAAPK